ncbi:HtaA domain-containing protein [Streptomyces sp. NPDC020799]|uniref:HtaA domain-containing protein n=1 Tax=unclassified Streptomyces TaxID=2593676 RepID=UPI0033F4D06B
MTVTARRAALAALATATALGATVLTAPAYAAEAPNAQQKADATTQLKEGKLTWGVAKSLREGLKTNGGTVTPTAVQQAKDNGEFTFDQTAATFDKSTGAISATFKGSVQFQGKQEADKSHKFDLKLSDLTVATAPKLQEKGSIKATVTKGGKETKNVEIATLDYTEHGVSSAPYSFEKIAAKLTEEGAKAFEHEGEGGKVEESYKKDQEIDPIAFSAKAAAEPSGGGDNAGGQGNEGQGHGNTGRANGGEQGKETGDKGKEGEQKAPARVADANLDWGLSQTFRKYIDDANGKATVSGGAERFKGGYRFPVSEGTYDPKTSTLNVTFKGSVRFIANGSDLNLNFSDFKVNVHGKTGSISANVTSRGDSVLEGKTIANLTIADFPKVKDGVLELSALPARLTADGAKAFKFKNDQIVKSGDALDPLTVAVAIDKNAKVPDMPSSTDSDKSTDTTDTTGATATNTSAATGGTGSTATTGGTTTDTTASGSLASTGANTPTGPLLGGAAALIVVGGGAVYAARRRKTGRQG